ncbi:hypothetical protein ACFL3X_01190 [Gemmatimonadota bacterium]
MAYELNYHPIPTSLRISIIIGKMTIIQEKLLGEYRDASNDNQVEEAFVRTEEGLKSLLLDFSCPDDEVRGCNELGKIYCPSEEECVPLSQCEDCDERESCFCLHQQVREELEEREELK